MRKILLVICLILVLSLTLFGCSNQNKELLCKSECIQYCKDYNMTYIPSRAELTPNYCIINCVCEKKTELTISFDENN